ncbi:unnamed protein product, partial [Ectocarpus sp. 4 AP-2014]
ETATSFSSSAVRVADFWSSSARGTRNGEGVDLQRGP